MNNVEFFKQVRDDYAIELLSNFCTYHFRIPLPSQPQPLKPSYTAKITAELGAALATVIPHPLYKPLIPCSSHSSLPVAQNAALLGWYRAFCKLLLVFVFAVARSRSLAAARPVRSMGLTSCVCIRLLIVSAGKKTKL